MHKRALISLILITACQATTGHSSPQGNSTSSLPSPLAEGYREQPKDGPAARAIKLNAQNLLNQKYPGQAIQLGTLIAYATQETSGINHRLEVEYRDMAGVQGRMVVVIFQDLKGAYSLIEDNYPAKGRVAASNR